MFFKLSAKFIFVIAALIALLIPQESASADRAQENVAYSNAIYSELVALRRDFFKHPERSGDEKRTSQIVTQYLTRLGLEVTANVGGYGVVGILRGAKPGKRIAWRADMDAANFEYDESSSDEVAHVCGHDVHTTIALGIANTLSQKVEHLEGTVYFLFQPAEESQQGAKAMISDGLFEMIQFDEIYASHVAALPTGVITTSAGNMFAHSRYLKIQFDGASEAQELFNLVQSTMASITRVNAPRKFADLLNTSDPKLGLNNPDTIYKDYVLFSGKPIMKTGKNRLEFSVEIMADELPEIDLAITKFKKQILTSKYEYRFNAIEVFHEREGVDNDAELVSQATRMIRASFGKHTVQDNYGRIPFASEDFGHFQKRAPGVYFLIGAANAEMGNVAFPHMPHFRVDERVIHHGVSRFSTLIVNRLQQ